MKQLLFVCMANTYRSYALHALFEKLIQEKGESHQFYIESCGMQATSGMQPERGVLEALSLQGISFDHPAKQFEPAFFQIFDIILPVTKGVETLLQSYAHTPEETKKIHLVTSYSCSYRGEDIPTHDVNLVLNMAQECCGGLYSSL